MKIGILLRIVVLDKPTNGSTWFKMVQISPTLKWFQIRKVTQYSFAPLRHCAHSRIRHTVLDSCNAHAMLRGWCFSVTEIYVNG